MSQSPEPREAYARAVANGSTADMCNALLAVVQADGDADWLQSECLGLLSHRDPAVGGLAATCLGHIARLHGVACDDVIAGLEGVREDTELGGRASDALDDIAQFVR